MTLHPHISLGFNGQCEAAFRFYERCLGGSASLLTWRDSMAAAEAPPGWEEKIVHATLKIGETMLMGSDVPPERYEQPKGFSVLLGVDDPTDAERVFHACRPAGHRQKHHRRRDRESRRDTSGVLAPTTDVLGT